MHDGIPDSIEVLSDDDSSRAREAFIDRFVESDGMGYQRIVGSTEDDGSYTTGYLWECLRSSCRDIAPVEARQRVADAPVVVALWDIPSQRRQWSRVVFEPYDRFPPGAAIRATGEALLQHRTLFPEDLYVSDPSGSWCIALTHETDEQDEELCILVEVGD